MPDRYIVFKVADADYAVSIDSIQQVEMADKITRVPNTPEFVDGVVYLRGQVVPVINLRSRFHMEKIPYSLHTRLIVIQQDKRTIALAVDSAREFLTIPADQVNPPPESLAGPGTEYLAGVAAYSNRLILIINLRQLLSAQERDALAEAPLE